MQKYLLLFGFLLSMYVANVAAADSLHLTASKTFGTSKTFTLVLDRETFQGQPTSRDCTDFSEICFKTAEGKITLESGTLSSNGRTDPVTYSIAIFNNKQRTMRIIYGGIWFNRERVSVYGVIDGDKSKFKAISLDRETPSEHSCLSDDGVFSRADLPSHYQTKEVQAKNNTNAHVISVLTAYTPEVKKKLGGLKEGVYAMIAYKFLHLRLAMKDSPLNVKFKVARTPFALRPSNVFGGAGATSALVNGDGIYDELHTLRKSSKADIVHIFNTGTSGVGFVPHGPLSANPLPGLARHAFSSSVVGELYFNGSAIFQHEIGHNLGAGHDVEAAPEGFDPSLLGFEPSAHGYRFTGTSGAKYATIMAYPGPDEIRINHYSSPNFLYDGVPRGSATADNVSTISYVASLVNQYSDNIDYPKEQKLYPGLSRNADDPDTYFKVERVGPDQAVLEKEQLQIVRDFGGGQQSIAAESENGQSSFQVALDSNGKYYARMYPDIYISSKIVKVPNLFPAVIPAKKVQSKIIGSVQSNSTLVTDLAGNWLTVAKLNPDTGEFSSVGTATIDKNGNFKSKSLLSGVYRVQFPVRSPFDDSVIVLKTSNQITIQ